VELGSDEAFAGYWNRPDADAKAIEDGWYRTGDTGHLDEDGDLWLDGRVDDMIVSGGENIHPLEVEEVLAAHPGVVEVAVIGAVDERSAAGRRGLVGSATPEELDVHCLASSLAPASSARASTVWSSRSEERIGEDPAQGPARRVEGERVSEYDGFRSGTTPSAAWPRSHARRAREVQPGLDARAPRPAAGLFAELDRHDAVRFVVPHRRRAASSRRGDHSRDS
jgi:acyl-CoA synthetase (AMP-forming)/AMP-acid ligase II